MKIRCLFKDPDTMPDAVIDALGKMEAPEGVSPDEWEDIRESRVETIQSQIADDFMEYSEYIEVEFDTEARTAIVVHRGDRRE